MQGSQAPGYSQNSRPSLPGVPNFAIQTQDLILYVQEVVTLQKKRFIIFASENERY